MLFLSEAVRERIADLVGDSAGAVSPGQARRVLELDPENAAAMLAVARGYAESGDDLNAEQWLWQAVRTQPCWADAYIRLSRFLEKCPERAELRAGLMEIVARKAMLDDEIRERAAGGAVDANDLPWLDTRSEPADVAGLLQPFRLTQRLQECQNPGRDLVDDVVREGRAMVPLLIGVLRGWARGFVQDDDRGMVENALALIGEIGDASAIAVLIEFANDENALLGCAAMWAIRRIAEKDSDAASATMLAAATEADESASAVIATQVMLLHHKIPREARILERLARTWIGSASMDARAFSRSWSPR